MKLLTTLKRLLADLGRSTQFLAEIVAGTANQSRLINDKFNETMSNLNHQSRRLEAKLDAIIAGLDNQTRTINEKLDALIDLQARQAGVAGGGEAPQLTQDPKDEPKARIGHPSPNTSLTQFQRPPGPHPQSESKAMPASADQAAAFAAAMQQIPLLLDEKTYNTSHPDYDATAVRNFPGHIFNADAPCGNRAYAELKKMARRDRVPDKAWRKVLERTLAEARSVPHAGEVFERRAFIEDYTAALHRKYGAHYAPGWVNLDDAIFLYWLVRQLRPRTIVQTGVCNGLSSAFMMLALANNGPDGRLHVIDLPPVFDPNDPAWTIKDKVYGVTIPEGKSSGWMVPDAYRDRIEILVGDAKDLLPKLVDKLDSIDMFYHDSDHTYNHMMFEFREARRKLSPGGLIVGDDISWNASVWDFADEYGAPSYNFKGAVGVAFF